MLFFLCSFASSLLFATIPVFFSRILCVVVFLLISKWICEIAKKTPRNEKHVDNGILYSLLNVFISCHCFFFLFSFSSVDAINFVFVQNVYKQYLSSGLFKSFPYTHLIHPPVLFNTIYISQVHVAPWILSQHSNEAFAIDSVHWICAKYSIPILTD